MTERRALTIWGASCVLCAVIIDHRAIIAMGAFAMGAWAIWLAQQEDA